MNFFRKIFKYIIEANVGELRLRMLVILGVVILVGGLLTSRIPAMAALSFGLSLIVAGILVEYVGQSVGRKIKRKKLERNATSKYI